MKENKTKLKNLVVIVETSEGDFHQVALDKDKTKAVEMLLDNLFYNTAIQVLPNKLELTFTTDTFTKNH